jgi:hypothetical protein
MSTNRLASFTELYRAWCARRALGKPYHVHPRNLLDSTGSGDVTADEWKEMCAVAEHSPCGYIEVYYYGMHYAMSVFTNEKGEKFANLLDMAVVRGHRLRPMTPVPPPNHPNCRCFAPPFTYC